MAIHWSLNCNIYVVSIQTIKTNYFSNYQSTICLHATKPAFAQDEDD